MKKLKNFWIFAAVIQFLIIVAIVLYGLKSEQQIKPLKEEKKQIEKKIDSVKNQKETATYEIIEKSNEALKMSNNIKTKINEKINFAFDADYNAICSYVSTYTAED